MSSHDNLATRFTIFALLIFMAGCPLVSAAEEQSTSSEEFSSVEERRLHVRIIEDQDSLIEEKGAVLLMPGRQSEKEDFIATVLRALLELVRHLQSAAVVKVQMEEDLAGQFIGGGVRGTVDLIATNVRGECAIVDIKWGGFDYRRKSLVESRYLQLAIYAQLARPVLKQW